MRTLDDKVVVITGAGSGIGRALALDLAGRGALLAVSDIDEAGLAGTVDLVKAAGVRELRSDHLDVADRAAFASYAAAVADHFGRVNVVVNNAEVSLTGDVEDLAYDDMDWVVAIDFWGVVHGTKEFLRWDQDRDHPPRPLLGPRGRRGGRADLRREDGHDVSRAGRWHQRDPGPPARTRSGAGRSRRPCLHQLARLTGSRYQDVVAAVARRRRPRPR